jgi:asparagine synthase (glutamine-hydrolysing)
MCGIVGIVSTEKRPPEAVLQRMLDSLRHRGPDDEGLWVGALGGLGSRRLSIIDLEGGHMPLANETEDVWVAYNGELYNHAELRRELEQLGHVYRTRSDAETVVHAYEEWGESAAEHFNGMFAAAVWDVPRRRLWLVRDQLGQKPLYYVAQSQQILFASELKALQLHPDCPAELDPAALSLYLQLGYVPSPGTWWQGVKQLPAGHWLLWEDGKIRTGEYWRPVVPEVFEEDPTTLKRQVRERVIRAVESRCMSDVPFGAFLSGGVDSTLIAGIITRELGLPLKTFSVGFADDLGGNEKFNVDRHYAQLAADSLGTDHREMIFSDASTMESELCKLHWYLDQPMYPPTVLSQYFVSKLARKEVGVCLSGDGGDELFGGYSRYAADRWVSLYAHLPLQVRKLAALGFGRFPGRIGKLIQKGSDDDPVARYLAFHAFIDRSEQEGWRTDERTNSQINEDVSGPINPYLVGAVPQRFTPYFALADLRLWLGEMSNACWDRMGMAHSLEVRAPFQDHDLVELAQTIPFDQKHKGNAFKVILKSAFADLLPAPIRNRPKWGFMPPASNWVRTCLKPLVETVLSRESVGRAGLLDPDKVWNITQDHLNKKRYGLPVVWQLLSLHLWHEIHVQGRRDSDGQV